MKLSNCWVSFMNGKRMRMEFLMTFSISLIIFSSAITPSVRYGMQTRKDELVSFSVASDQITLHEPMVIIFAINNTYDETLKIDLGRNRKQHFRFKLTRPDGSTQTNRLGIEEGAAWEGEMTIPPGQSHKQQLLVNEWFDISQTGNYTVSVEMTTQILSKEGQVITEGANNNFSINVLPRNPEKLREVCDNILYQITTSDSYVPASEYAVALSYIKDRILLAIAP